MLACNKNQKIESASYSPLSFISLTLSKIGKRRKQKQKKECLQWSKVDHKRDDVAYKEKKNINNKECQFFKEFYSHSPY
jgi:hypothetical protein